MLFLTISTLAKITFVLTVLLTFAPILVWAERRQSAMMQDRVGPVRAGIPMPDYRGLVAAGVLLFLGAWAQHMLVSFFLYDGAGFVWGLVPLLGPGAQALEEGSLAPAFATIPQALTIALAMFGFYSRMSCADFLRGPAALGAKAVAASLAVGSIGAMGYAGYLGARQFLFGMAAEEIAAAPELAALLEDVSASDYRTGVANETREALQTWQSYGIDTQAVIDALGPLASGASTDTARFLTALDAAYAPAIRMTIWIAFALAVGAIVHVVAAYLVKRVVDDRDELTAFGLIHPVADAVKMIWKEDFTPPRADKFLYAAAPIIATIPAFATFAVIPFGPDVLIGPEGDPLYWLTEVVDGAVSGSVMPLQVANINVGILYIFAIAGTGIIGAAIAGYSSDNKYSLLGGLRAASQMVSYEVTLGLTIVGCFMVYQTLLLDQMVAWQAEHHLWGFIIQPLGLILFFFASIAEMKRVPFDAPEGESEIVAGYFLEYSGMKFGLFMTGEFVEHVVTSGIIVTLFFGGYLVPFLEPGGFVFDYFGYEIPIWHVGVVALSIGAFIVKMALVMFLQLQVRWTLPRFRYDQTMQLCWKIILPLSLVNILVTGVVILLLE